jgi:signal transduction histidine kinase
VSERSVVDADTSFPRLVSLAAHDLRTPLAPIHGFAQTRVRMGDLPQPKQRYLEMIDLAALQLAELLDELGLAARIEGGRYEPNLQPTDTRELAAGSAEELGSERVTVDGTGTSVRVDRESVQRGGSALVQAALRHGGLEQVTVAVDGPTISISPVTAASGPVLLGQDLRDLGAAVAVLLIDAHGGSVDLDGEVLSVRFAE